MNMEGPLAPNVLDGGKLKPELAAKGVKLSRIVDPEISLHLLEHAGPGRRRPRARRRSRCAARWRWRTTSTRRSRSSATARRSRRSTRSRRASSATIPDWTERASGTTRPAPTRCSTGSATRRAPTAGARCPTASRWSIRYASRPDTLGRQQDEMWKKSFDAIGVRMEVQKDKFPELLKLEKQCKLHDAHRGVDRRLPGRRQLHAAPLRPEHRTRATTPARRSPSTTSSTSRRCGCRTRPGARQALPGDGAIIEAYAPWRLDDQPLPQHAGRSRGC